MKDCITLTADERATLLDHLRQAPQPELRLRAHIVLLLADGYAWASIAAVIAIGCWDLIASVGVAPWILVAAVSVQEPWSEQRSERGLL